MNISKFFFNSKCCNTVKSNTYRVVNSLVEPLRKKPALIMAPYIALSPALMHEFTVTFNLNKLRFRTPASYQGLNEILYDSFKEKIGRYVVSYLFPKKLEVTYRILFVPEFMKNGMLHFHALAYIDNASHYYDAKLKNYCNKQFGRCTGKVIYNISNFTTYISKTIGHTGPLIPFEIVKVKKELSNEII